MPKIRTLVLLGLSMLVAPTYAAAQAPPDPDYVRRPLFETYADFRDALDAATGIGDAATRTAAVDVLWQDLTNAGQTPFAVGNRVAFLYRGAATSVGWRGDFNRWGVAAGVKLGQSDVWIHEATFPSDARTDYKVFLNGSNWVLDPANPLQMWGGFGPNSELRMPSYEYPQETIRKAGVARGTLTPPIRFASQNLGNALNYRVYTPAGYELGELANLPTVYVTDGHEYAADHLGSMAAVMDNLIAEGTLAPAIAVFIDPRDPATGQNLRAELYLANAEFADFVADELMPTIDAAFRTDARREARTILGTSYGGFFSAYFGAYRSDAVRNLALQSPALSLPLIDVYANYPLQGQNIVMTGGTFGDDTNPNALADALTAAGYDFSYEKVNDGHSWGAWRAQLDSVLLKTVGPPIPEPSTAALGMSSLGLVSLSGLLLGRGHAVRD
ncbi:alpha/beta hydrolase [Botrimarina hoheduenensis]|uniref:Carbohydrate acetyl esterase/feruloyl esterase n=1 Tax=Botrimarina hoheduenensis TaxID=2528000 RepID=A0A5C5VZ17_9BACT|nr:alpha/beta hydrolase-fold protein [Botrimarina hoheduenensis]TWT43327.1 Carbohydrate acetyl esterase/feruloyl esterase precursor [Botrimarina hoheduenensis]